MIFIPFFSLPRYFFFYPHKMTGIHFSAKALRSAELQMGRSWMCFLHKLYKLKQGYFFALPSPSLAEGVWMGEVWHDGCFCVLFDKDGVWRGVVTVGVTQGWVLCPLQFLCSHLICLFPSLVDMLCAVLSFVSSSPAVLYLCVSLWIWKTLLWRDVSLEK